ncbi:MAG TPA: hypothetical protein VK629_17500, partial [Steroidobacteraceae bacterium]|nr:hypothetical protein [Steroidobacteraceae bacterium]
KFSGCLDRFRRAESLGGIFHGFLKVHLRLRIIGTNVKISRYPVMGRMFGRRYPNICTHVPKARGIQLQLF